VGATARARARVWAGVSLGLVPHGETCERGESLVGSSALECLRVRVRVRVRARVRVRVRVRVRG